VIDSVIDGESTAETLRSGVRPINACALSRTVLRKSFVVGFIGITHDLSKIPSKLTFTPPVADQCRSENIVIQRYLSDSMLQPLVLEVQEPYAEERL